MKEPLGKGIIKEISGRSPLSKWFSYYHPWNALSEMGHYSLNDQSEFEKDLKLHQTLSELGVIASLFSKLQCFLHNEQ